MERVSSILIVSNDEKFRRKAVQYFLEMGYRVQTAENGTRAISTIIEPGAEAVLIQAQLPGLSGFDTAVIIKKIDPKVRVIMSLEDETFPSIEETKQIDFFECFVEPINLSYINEALRSNRVKEEGRWGK